MQFKKSKILNIFSFFVLFFQFRKPLKNINGKNIIKLGSFIYVKMQAHKIENKYNKVESFLSANK